MVNFKGRAKVISIYLKKDEDKALKEILASQKNNVPKGARYTRHRLLKFAIRRFLFPNEKIVPLNGLAVELRDGAPYRRHKLPVPHKLIIDGEEVEFEADEEIEFEDE